MTVAIGGATLTLKLAPTMFLDNKDNDDYYKRRSSLIARKEIAKGSTLLDGPIVFKGVLRLVGSPDDENFFI